MKMNKAFILISFIISGVTVYNVFTHPQNSEDSKPDHWQTFSKKGDEVNISDTSQKDITNLRLPSNKGRTPASVKESKGKFHQGRLLTGDHGENMDFSSLVMTNKYNKKWKDLLGKQLMHHQLEGSKVYIKKEQSLLHTFKGKGELREIVQVSVKLPNAHRGNYRALINSETGKVISTWDRSFEHNGIRPKELKGFSSQSLQATNE